MVNIIRIMEKYFLFFVLKICISDSSNARKIGIKKYINIWFLVIIWWNKRLMLNASKIKKTINSFNEKSNFLFWIFLNFIIRIRIIGKNKNLYWLKKISNDFEKLDSEEKKKSIKEASERLSLIFEGKTNVDQFYIKNSAYSH